MFGKLMSISDETMAPTTRSSWGKTLPEIHPMEAKKQFAARIVERFHGPEAAKAALEDFNTRFSKRDLADAELPEVPAAQLPADIVSIVVAAYLQAFQLTKSKADARRLVEQGSIQLNGQKITDPKATPALEGGTCCDWTRRAPCVSSRALSFFDKPAVWRRLSAEFRDAGAASIFAVGKHGVYKKPYRGTTAISPPSSVPGERRHVPR